MCRYLRQQPWEMYFTGYSRAEDTSPLPLQQAIVSGIVNWNGRKLEFPPPVEL
jgi:hypothetical protein